MPMRPASTRLGAFVAALATALASGCSPTFDWRETRVDGTGLRALFPCRPDRHERTVRLGGEPVRLTMLACPAGGSTFSLAYAALVAPERVTPALEELRGAMVANVAAKAPRVERREVPGATPNAAAGLVHVEGNRPDGRRVVADAAFFASGLTVVQATVLGEQPVPADVVETFLAALRVAPPR
jgi:hypothetical protein